MSILSFIQTQYGFNDVEWEATDHLFHTERGLKKILLWKDHELASWHSQWRDELGKIDSVFIDRMILTKTGQKIVQYEDKWLTCHDASRSFFPIKGNEVVLGHFIGSLLSSASHHHTNTPTNQQHLSIDEGISSIKALKKVKWENSFDILIKCLPSAKRRLKYSHSLKSNVATEGIPYMPPLPIPSHVRQLYGQLFWEPGQEAPTVGFESLITFLSHSLNELGDKRMMNLLDAMDAHYSLKGETGQRLIADLVYPSEWLTCLRALMVEEDPDRIGDILAKFKTEWDHHSILLKVLNQWMDSDREQVAT